MATRGRGVDQIRSFISDGLRVGYLYFMNPNFVIEYCWHESQGKAKYVSASPSISPEIISSCTTFARIPELHWSRPIHSMPIYDRQRSSTAKMPMILHLANRAYLGKKKNPPMRPCRHLNPLPKMAQDIFIWWLWCTRATHPRRDCHIPIVGPPRSRVDGFDSIYDW